ncbi:hypothetical protein E2C01_046957 [Portunus trituberculatus]|uniref:Uncharacterized protein n=1 Tax=Portunus trituberculatus TaxID=210409 RepID=A0A5B7G742_PORTR|nr:hypothetical protein [Portunus trituberculatus]
MGVEQCNGSGGEGKELSCWQGERSIPEGKAGVEGYPEAWKGEKCLQAQGKGSACEGGKD